MKKFTLSLCLLILVFLNCNKKSPSNTDNLDDELSVPQNIRWGTQFNTLRGVTISWQNMTTNDSLRWGYKADYEMGTHPAKQQTVTSDNFPDDVKLFNFVFPVLKPSSVLYYAIKSQQTWLLENSFETGADTNSEYFSFVAGGDSHGADSDFMKQRWHKMSDLIVKDRFDFMLHLGDAVHDGDEWEQWQDWFHFGENLIKQSIIFYTWGNHDYDLLAINNFTLPENKKWYSFKQGNALFICLLSEEDFSTQYEWLLDQLSHCNAEWIFIYFHRPFFTRGSHKDEMNDLRSTWWKAFDDYGVDVVMSGHTHSYIRSKPLNLNISDTSAVAEYGSFANQGRLNFVAGGLGGENSKKCNEWFAAKAYSGLFYIRFEINGSSLHFDTFDESHVLIDSLTLNSSGTKYKKIGNF